jgi:hypothetical protein
VGILVSTDVFGGLDTDLVVPQGYVSGNPLSDTSIYDNATFASLGVILGTYVWRWGTGADADSFTLNITAAAVSEPSELSQLGSALPGWCW